MPITKQVIKRVKQAKKRTESNQHYRSHMKSMIKLILGYVQKKEAGKAAKILPKVVSAIDTCAKKNIIHENNAARKKARIQKALSNIGKGGAEKVEPSSAKAAKTPKKEAKPKTEKKETKPKAEKPVPSKAEGKEAKKK